MRIVIIGNGVAGIEAALQVRQREPHWDITIVSEESDHFFSRTALMWVVSGQLSHHCIEPYERDLYERMDFKRVRARATGIDATKREVALAGGLPALPYDRLLIACGSRPRRGPWPGSDLEGIGHFVTHQDLAWLEAELHGGPSHGGPAPRADAHLQASTEDSPYRPRTNGWQRRGGAPKSPVVIGGGLIGIEAVEVMHAAGLHPRFFIREEWFWPMAIEKRESTWISERMAAHGVHVHLGENVEALQGDGHLASIRTDKGEYDADVAVVAIGVVPNTQWLADSAIHRDRREGIVVDAQLQCQDAEGKSIDGVFAAGDCASVRWFNGTQMPQQLWYTAKKQGMLAARGLLGDSAYSYERGPWYNSAKLFDIEYTTAGLVNMNLEGEQNFFFEEQGKVRSTTRITVIPHKGGNRVVGFNLLGRRWDHSILLQWVDEHRSLDWVLKHLNEASFDTEFVPPLVIPQAPKALEGPAPSLLPNPVIAPAV